MQTLRVYFAFLAVCVFLSAAPVYAACTNPAGEEGQVVYNSTHKVMQFCDGTNWQAMGCQGNSSTFFNTSNCSDGEALAYDLASEKFICPPDISPDAFTFTDQTSVAVSTAIESNIVLVSNMDNGTAISISGSGTQEYRICDDDSCSTAPSYTSTAGTINAGKYVQLRLTSSASYGTANTATLTIGNVSDEWSVTTLNSTPPAYDTSLPHVNVTIGGTGNVQWDWSPPGSGYDGAWWTKNLLGLKVYAEAVATIIGNGNNHMVIGVGAPGYGGGDISYQFGDGGPGGAWRENGTIFYLGGTAAPTTFSQGDVIGMAFDGTNGQFQYYKNGVAVGSVYTVDNWGEYSDWRFGTNIYSDSSNASRTVIQTTPQYSVPSGYTWIGDF